MKKIILSALVAAATLTPTAAQAGFHNQGNYGQAVGKAQTNFMCGQSWAASPVAWFVCPWPMWEYDYRG